MKVLCLMDYGVDVKTGFGTVSNNIKKNLKNYFKKELELDVIGVNHFGESYIEPDGTTVISAKLSDFKKDDFGRHQFLKMIKEGNYNGVFIITDLGVMLDMLPIIASLHQEKKEMGKKLFKLIWYFPVDCNLFPALVKNIDCMEIDLVTYTEFARKEIYRLKPKLFGKVTVIPHGNNCADFYPINGVERKEFRKKWFGDAADKFIITNVNRNQPRKDLPNTILGFIEAKRKWGNKIKPFLYLHCHPSDPMGHGLRVIFHQTDLEEGEDFMLLPHEYEHSLVDIKTVNLIYNASDLFITTSLGEGWGLSITEAFATRLPVICPATTSMKEISAYGKRATLLETIIPFVSPTDNIIREQTDYMEVGEMIIEVANKIIDERSSTHLKQGSIALKTNEAYKWVTENDWKEVCKKWIDKFKNI